MSNQHKVIENIINKDAKIAFILESPHKDEICEGYPLAGESGIEISKKLIGDSADPFGKEAKKRKLIKVSIINVSKKPLQGNAYCCKKNRPSDIANYEYLKKRIEQGATYSTKHNKKEINILKKEIFESFLDELKLLPKNSFIVPCGKFAREFYNEAEKDESLKDKKFQLLTKEEIPHPARGNWLNLSDDIIQQIKEKIEKKP